MCLCTQKVRIHVNIQKLAHIDLEEQALESFQMSCNAGACVYPKPSKKGLCSGNRIILASFL